MFSSQKDLILTLYKNPHSVFRLNEIAMLTGISDFQSLSKKLNYYVHSGKILNPRKGIYAKPEYSKEELACCIFIPSYISLEFVLQKAGVIFQYDSKISSVSYLSRNITIENTAFLFRKIKNDILFNNVGINTLDNKNIAIPERAFLDLFYLEKDCYFDNLTFLDKKKINTLLPIYQSKALIRRVAKLLKNV